MNNSELHQKIESLPGFLLIASALLAMILANSNAKIIYDSFLATPLTLSFGKLLISKSLVLWINDGLMAIFFLLVGLEIKRELIQGKLKTFQIAMLPIGGAIGGMIIPGLIYFAFNHADPIALKGWAIPVATDIAFSLAVLTLLGNRIPISLKLFLTALAIIDDIGAVIIIALFYTAHLSFLSLAIAALAVIFLVFLNRSNVKNLTPYILLGIILWLSVLESGVHAALSGIVLAFTIPLDPVSETNESPLEHLEKLLLPWVNLFILPLFAFANSGFSIAGITLPLVFHPITLGIILGLVLGKQLGIFSSCWIMVKLGWAKLPHDVNWQLFYGMSILCGIGFTMSLFIGSLAFQSMDDSYSTMVRFSVMIASLLSAIFGVLVLSFHHRRLKWNFAR